MELGEQIATLREEKTLTQVELAEKANISPSTLSQIESGRVPRPHVGTVRKIARALGVEPAELRKVSPEELTTRPKAQAPPPLDELEKSRSRNEYPPVLDLSNEQFEVLVREAADDELGDLKRELAPHLPPVRVIGDRNDTLHRAQRIAISRILAIVREQDARLKVEKKRLEELIPA